MHRLSRLCTLQLRSAPRAAAMPAQSPGDDDDDSTYPTSDATPILPLKLARSNLLPGSYIVVAETKAPHHTLATAQRLPDLAFFGVVGAISASDGVDFYRLTLNENADQINFGIAFENSGQTAAIDFQILNEEGQLLGEWSSDQGGSSVLLAQLGLKRPARHFTSE